MAVSCILAYFGALKFNSLVTGMCLHSACSALPSFRRRERQASATLCGQLWFSSRFPLSQVSNCVESPNFSEFSFRNRACQTLIPECFRARLVLFPLAILLSCPNSRQLRKSTRGNNFKPNTADKTTIFDVTRLRARS